MARRIESALASIFLPRDSVYTQLDEPPAPSPSLQHSPTSTTRNPLAHQPRSPPPTALQQEQDEDDTDPFAPTSPSVISSTGPRHSTQATRDSPPPPHRPRLSPPADPPTAGGLGDSRSPFHPHPLDHPHSLYASTHPRVTPSHSQRGVGAGDSMAVSSIGNRSLIGLLGGTRYDFSAGGGAGLEAGGGIEEEELDEEQESEEMDGLGQLRRGGRVEGMSLAESRALASSLPPPPSALSSSSPSTSEDEEDEPPSDLTSRVPLVSSSSRSRRRPHPSSSISSSSRPSSRRGGPIGGILGGAQNGLSARERALWRWINVEDLDGFLQKVYLYYVGKGIWTMVLGRVVDLLTVGWVISFSTFLVGCIDYGKLWDAHSLAEVVVPQCVARFSTLHLLLFLSFASFYLYRVIRFGLGVKELWEMHEFFGELLGVEENDIQTIPWSLIVTRLSTLRASHPSALSSRSTSHPTAAGHPLDAHDIANRIMREENYLIALFNKDVLDLSLPLPGWVPEGVRSRLGGGGGGGRTLTKALEWNLGVCLLGFLFGADGQVRRAFLGERNKGELVEALRRRFILMGIINAVFAPFIVLYLLMYSFFRYFEEYHQNPSTLSSRTFTPSPAGTSEKTYVAQFPKAKTALLSRFVAFVAGSFAAVLILFSLIDPEAFLHFEVTKGRTVLFYIGVFGGILAVARGMVPEEHRVVDVEEVMRRIVEQTHYCPEEWRGKLHSAEVHTTFSALFPLSAQIYLQELLSVLLTPFILLYSLPRCSGAIVDFFREFTVHVDGLGYVCSFAVFDFKRHGDVRFGAPVQVQEERWKSGEGKMEKSFLNFAAHNPSWIPRDQTQSLFLSKMTESTSHPPPPPPPSTRHAPSTTATGLHPRFSSASNPHARSSSRGHRFAGGGLGASIMEEGSTFGALATGGGGGASSLPSSRILDPSSGGARSGGGGSRLRPTHTPSPSSTRLGVRLPPHRSSAAHPAPPPAEAPIIEESTLDGQSFVAPTEGQPFGFRLGSEDGEEGGWERSRGSRGY
ncbi:autophagy protein Apg9-domain-containing protein [Leucosporidium creatinivorum]|uniref:Autophagy-related protein 9 n=1 Tax=Leucosporidium creatinivorum TaxID=106004 RepID=A0A1Y2C186_9BASI|nr:autophagy protein Apg9-domain-containing protein [Leucosporidium creatinivorum]